EDLPQHTELVIDRPRRPAGVTPHPSLLVDRRLREPFGLEAADVLGVDVADEAPAELVFERLDELLVGRRAPRSKEWATRREPGTSGLGEQGKVPLTSPERAAVFDLLAPLAFARLGLSLVSCSCRFADEHAADHELVPVRLSPLVEHGSSSLPVP